MPAHVRSSYLETFEILKGRARYRLGSETKTAAAGERVVMPSQVPHLHPWSDSDEEFYVRQVADSDPPDLRGLNCQPPGCDRDLGSREVGPCQLERVTKPAAARRPDRDDEGDSNGRSDHRVSAQARKRSV